jgi:hypothetical protein
MAQQQPTGVCLVRVQPQSASLVITVIENPDISSRHGETSRSFSDVTAALDAVREFIGRFTVPPAPHLPNGTADRYGPASACGRLDE